MKIGLLDCIFFVVILIFAVSASVKGFIREILGKAAWILSVILSILFYDEISLYFANKIENQTLRYILAFCCIFLVVFLVVKVIEMILSKIFSGEITGGMNKALGFLLGIAEGFVLVFAVLFIFQAQPWIDFSGITRDSEISKFYEKNIAPVVIKTVNDELLVDEESEELQETESDVEEEGASSDSEESLDENLLEESSTAKSKSSSKNSKQKNNKTLGERV